MIDYYYCIIKIGTNRGLSTETHKMGAQSPISETFDRICILNTFIVSTVISSYAFLFLLNLYEMIRHMPEAVSAIII